MSEIEVYAPWMFPDNWERATLEYVESKKGNHGQELWFCGAKGDFRTFPGKIQNLSSLIKTLGKDDKTWAGKKFVVDATDDKTKFFLTIV